MTSLPSTPPNHAAPETYERLHARQAELLARLAAVQRATLDHARSPQDHDVTDLKDEAEREERDLLADAQAQRDHAELVEVRAAIARLQDSCYGVCMACGAPIDQRRLRARPEALRCAACQAAYEALTIQGVARQ
ncbi:MAG: conjugal transfer protein TraR [Variovorax paradoxus]|nr:MAG: conjugal transfer protein TraR [Variovorax paradoxus]PZQ04497.1 MAG: conjugal transfer protein TraR [Variovorax paradoxus]